MSVSVTDDSGFKVSVVVEAEIARTFDGRTAAGRSTLDLLDDAVSSVRSEIGGPE